MKLTSISLILHRLINHVVKHGSSLANTLGVVSVMYTCFGVFLSYVRGTDDSLNTLAAATATGMLFKSTGYLNFSILIFTGFLLGQSLLFLSFLVKTLILKL